MAKITCASHAAAAAAAAADDDAAHTTAATADAATAATVDNHWDSKLKVTNKKPSSLINSKPAACFDLCLLVYD